MILNSEELIIPDISNMNKHPNGEVFLIRTLPSYMFLKRKDIGG